MVELRLFFLRLSLSRNLQTLETLTWRIIVYTWYAHADEHYHDLQKKHITDNTSQQKHRRDSSRKVGLRIPRQREKELPVCVVERA